MDNDYDGVVDDPEVHRFLVDNNFVVPVWTEELRDRVFPSLRGSFCEDNLGWAASMYFGEDRWAFGGVRQAGSWDTNLEEIWHVLSMGWYHTYPEYFGDEPGSRLCRRHGLCAQGSFKPFLKVTQSRRGTAMTTIRATISVKSTNTSIGS